MRLDQKIYFTLKNSLENGYFSKMCIRDRIGTPREIYYHPKSRFVADFIGEANFLKAVSYTHLDVYKRQGIGTAIYNFKEDVRYYHG